MLISLFSSSLPVVSQLEVILHFPYGNPLKERKQTQKEQLTSFTIYSNSSRRHSCSITHIYSKLTSNFKFKYTSVVLAPYRSTIKLAYVFSSYKFETFTQSYNLNFAFNVKTRSQLFSCTQFVNIMNSL